MAPIVNAAIPSPQSLSHKGKSHEVRWRSLCGIDPATPVERVGGTVGDNTPPPPIAKTATSLIPLLATYRNDPLGDIGIPSGLDPVPVENVGGVVAVNTPPVPMEKPDTLLVPVLTT